MKNAGFFGSFGGTSDGKCAKPSPQIKPHHKFRSSASACRSVTLPKSASHGVGVKKDLLPWKDLLLWIDPGLAPSFHRAGLVLWGVHSSNSLSLPLYVQ